MGLANCECINISMDPNPKLMT